MSRGGDLAKPWRWAAIVAALGVPGPAVAHPLFFERYLVCNLDDEPSVEPAKSADPRAPAPQDFVLLPRRSSAPSLEPLPLVVADLVQPSPIGVGNERLDPVVAVALPSAPAGASLDYRCIGLPRGRAGILRVLSGSLQKRYRGEHRAEDTVERNAIAAGTFALAETAPAMRAKLERAIPEDFEPWMKLERLRMKVTLAEALADLGDRETAPILRSFLVERERTDFPGFWEDALPSLVRLDPAMAERYALDALGRVADAKELGTAEENRVRKLLPVLKTPSREAVSLLQRLSAREDPGDEGRGFHACLLMAARVRMGDAELKKALAGELATDLRTNRSATCYSELIEVVFPGEDLAELDTLLYRQRYHELLALVIRFGADPSPPAKAARAKLLAWLDARLGEPDIDGGKGDRRFHVTHRAIHLALMARLGSTRGETALFDLIRDPEDDSIGPWIAARAALDLGLSGAEEAAVARLRLGITQHTSRFERDSWPHDGDLIVTEHGEIVRRLAARRNVGFTLGLLDRQEFTRHVTAHALARTPMKEACALVVGAAAKAEERAAQDAFWSLTILGDACRPTFEAALDAKGTTDDVRGAAIEGRAMLRKSEDVAAGSALRARLATAPKGSTAAWERARDVLRSAE